MPGIAGVLDGGNRGGLELDVAPATERCRPHNRNTNETTSTSATVAKLRVEYSLGRLTAYGPCGRPSEHASVATVSTVYHFDGRRVIATDLTTGETRWRSADLSGASGVQVTDLAVAGSRLILRGSGGCVLQSDPGLFVVGLDIANGS